MIPSSELGDRPLDGRYVARIEAGDEQALTSWATSIDVRLLDSSVRSTRAITMTVLMGTGAGFAFVGVVLVLIALGNAWFFSMSRSRSIRLQAGMSTWQIHVWAMWLLARTLLLSIGLGFAGFLVLFVAVFGGAWLVRFLPLAAAATACATASVLAVFAVISWVTRPTVRLAAEREIPWKGITRTGMGIEVLAVVLALMCVPFSMNYTNWARQAASEGARWQAASDVVRVTASSLTLSESRSGDFESRLTPLLDTADDEGILGMSFSLDQMIEIQQDMGGFDHIVLTNPTFMTLMDAQSDLAPLSSSDIPINLREELGETLAMWSMNPDDPWEGIALYTTLETRPFPVIGTQADAGNAVTANHPLVLVATTSVSSFHTSGFLDVLVSNGQIVFTDASRLRELIDINGLSEYLVSIDYVADQILETTHLYRQQAQLGGFAIAMSLAALVLVLGQSAVIWSRRKRRMIFIHHTNGSSFVRIQLEGLAPAVCLLLLSAVLAAASAVVVLQVGLPLAVASSGIFLIICVPLEIAFRTFAARTESSHQIGRKN